MKYVIIIIILFALSSFFSGKENNETDTTSRTIPAVEANSSRVETDKKSGQQVETDKSSGSDQFEIHFIDVGQGDAILVNCNDHYMLVDGGRSSNSSKIYSYLKNAGADHLDIIVATHPDADHIGGLAAALNYASVDMALSPVEYDNSESFQDFQKYLDQQDVPITVPSAGDQYTLGDATVTVLGPIESVDNENNNSIVLRIEHNINSYLLAADAEEKEEEDIINAKYDIKSTVLKVGHHGSASSTSDKWLDYIQPKYAVISCGYENEYGHPTEEVLDKLKQRDIKVLRTDLQGNIVFREEDGDLDYSVLKNLNAEVFIPRNLISETEITERSIPSTEIPEKVKETYISKSIEQSYIVNTNTKVFHHPGCRSVSRMKDKNKKEYTGTREDLISQGYRPCGNCHP